MSTQVNPRARTYIRAIGELLRDRRRRTTGHAAENRHGAVTGATSPDACRWCLLGAMNVVTAAYSDQIIRKGFDLETELRKYLAAAGYAPSDSDLPVSVSLVHTWEGTRLIGYAESDRDRVVQCLLQA